MPIEFSCPQCQHLLRTPDDAAGKQARCPQCGHVFSVPRGGDANPAPTDGLPDLSGGALAGSGSAGLPASAAGGQAWQAEGRGAAPAGGGDNPYQSPSFAPQYGAANGDVPRTGPAWEREGPGIGSFIETVKECFRDVVKFYGTMRRDGGNGLPLGFAVAGGCVGACFNVLYEFLQQMFLGGEPLLGQDADGSPAGLVLGMLCVLIIAPLAVVLWVTLCAAAAHLVLMMLGGANHPFEASLRVIAYTYGASSLVFVVPFCGQFIALLINVVFCCIGLSQVHETTGLKASAAVLIPTVLCVGAAVGIGVLLVAAASV